MSGILQISGKTLGGLALPGSCRRCSWVRLHCKLPYQIFPGIFSSIDAYTKKVVHGQLDRGGVPPWLGELGAISRYVEPPGWRDFQWSVDPHRILLTGAPDAVFVRPDGTYLIADYKTARFTQGQDELLPMYEVQLNAYALIAEHLGMKPVTGLALLYMEPRTESGDALRPDNQRSDGFAMGFSAHVHPIRLDPPRVWSLLEEARALFDLASPPDGEPGCKDCAAIATLLSTLKRPSS
ncbi:MAG TPA: PD-(D/E)XK nuclease family protein [Planctomycetota bacterium]|nr:PD-(D/E)XK nuclease family protein [Planctomycetota bacterium]